MFRWKSRNCCQVWWKIPALWDHCLPHRSHTCAYYTQSLWWLIPHTQTWDLALMLTICVMLFSTIYSISVILILSPNKKSIHTFMHFKYFINSQDLSLLWWPWTSLFGVYIPDKNWKKLERNGEMKDKMIEIRYKIWNLWLFGWESSILILFLNDPSCYFNEDMHTDAHWMISP